MYPKEQLPCRFSAPKYLRMSGPTSIKILVSHRTLIQGGSPSRRVTIPSFCQGNAATPPTGVEIRVPAESVLVARHPERIELRGVHRVRLDVTDPDNVAAIGRGCDDVNLLINNLGASLWSGFVSPYAIESARLEMEINYFGTLLLSRIFAPVLAANGGGAIVNVLSALSWISVPDGGTYSASTIHNNLNQNVSHHGGNMVIPSSTPATGVHNPIRSSVPAPMAPDCKMITWSSGLGKSAMALS